MRRLTTATLAWFDDGCCDVKYLDLWQNVPLNFTPTTTFDETWHQDAYAQRLGHDANGRLFATAADLLMRYQFYPPRLMHHVADFTSQDRWAAVGDRIVQRIHLAKFFGQPILDVIGMTEITAVWQAPNKIGFTYTTVDTHVEQGTWSAWISRQPTGEVQLHVEAISRPKPDEPARNYPFMRRFQKMAHRVGMAHFVRQVETAVRHPANATS